MLPKGYKTIIGWFQEVGLDPDYVNPTFERFDFEEDEVAEKPLEGGVVELSGIEEVKDDEENMASRDKLKVGEETKVGGVKGEENRKPGEESS